MPLLNAAADAWTQFFHQDGPATPVAAFRIAFGCVLLLNAVTLRRDLAYLYGPDGALGAAHRDRAFQPRRLSLFAVMPATLPRLQACLLIHGIAAIFLTVGLLTTISAVVVFVTLISLQRRNPLVTYGGDDVLRVMSFLLMFSPAGDTWSADAWMAHGSWRYPATGSVWCLRLMQLQVSLIYIKAVAAKLAGETWRSGSAVYLATEVADFRRRRLPAWARGVRGAQLLTWGTLAIEGALGTVIWLPVWRVPIVVAGIAMHATMEWFLNVFLFGAAMIACLLLFLSYP